MIHTTYWVPRGEGRLLYRLLNVNRTNKIIVYAVTIFWYLRRLKFYQEIFTKKQKTKKTLIVMFRFDEFKEVEVQINHQIALKAVNFSIIKIYFLALKFEHFLVSSYRALHLSEINIPYEFPRPFNPLNCDLWIKDWMLLYIRKKVGKTPNTYLNGQ